MSYLRSIFYLVAFFVAFNISAQENKGITANELLKTLNKVDDLEIESSKQSAFKDLNASFVNDLKDLAKSPFSKDDKKVKFKNLVKKREKGIQSLLGKNGYEKYKKKAEKTFKKTKRKAKWSLINMVL